jgi:NTP pyrophosphatase (non-canonical NTP hydrolase)
MYEQINFQELVEQCHNAAKAKGFWEVERNIGEAKALIISELCEALEAARKGKYTNKKVYADIVFLHLNNDEEFVAYFKEHIKDTVEDELADTIIRTFDYIGGFFAPTKELAMPTCKGLEPSQEEMSVNFCNILKYHQNKPKKEIENIGESIYDAIAMLIQFDAPIYFLTNVFMLAKELEVPILFHIQAKLRYNSTRPQKHGKQF